MFVLLLVFSNLFFWRFAFNFGESALPVYLLFAVPALAFGSRRIPLSFVFQHILIWGFVLFSLLLALAFGVTLERPLVTFLSIPLIFTTSIVSDKFLLSINSSVCRVISSLMQIVLVVLLACQIVQLLGLPLFPDNKVFTSFLLPINRVCGFVKEPSHLALVVSPHIFAAFFNSKRLLQGYYSRFNNILLLIILLISPSLVAVVAIVLAISLKLVYLSERKLRHWFLVLIFLVTLTFVLVLFYNIFNQFVPFFLANRIDQFLQLVNGSYEFSNTTNLSSLVFYGGFNAASHSLSNYPFSGVGHQNLPFIYNLPFMSDYLLISRMANINDSSSLVFKLISEFGIFGVLVLMFILFRFFLLLRSSNLDLLYPMLAFPILISFFRFVGYFEGGVILSFSVLLFDRKRMISHSFLPS